MPNHSRRLLRPQGIRDYPRHHVIFYTWGSVVGPVAARALYDRELGPKRRAGRESPKSKFQSNLAKSAP